MFKISLWKASWCNDFGTHSRANFKESKLGPSFIINKDPTRYIAYVGQFWNDVICEQPLTESCGIQSIIGGKRERIERICCISVTATLLVKFAHFAIPLGYTCLLLLHFTCVTKMCILFNTCYNQKLSYDILKLYPYSPPWKFSKIKSEKKEGLAYTIK